MSWQQIPRAHRRRRHLVYAASDGVAVVVLLVMVFIGCWVASLGWR
jgi:hypothetical protein